MRERNFVDPNILMWPQDLLWARYLEIMVQWRADVDTEKSSLLVYESPGQLINALRKILNDAVRGCDDEGLKLRWEILLAFGYGTFKEWLKWADAETEKITGEIADLLDIEELNKSLEE